MQIIPVEIMPQKIEKYYTHGNLVLFIRVNIRIYCLATTKKILLSTKRLTFHKIITKSDYHIPFPKFSHARRLNRIDIKNNNLF